MNCKVSFCSRGTCMVPNNRVMTSGRPIAILLSACALARAEPGGAASRQERNHGTLSREQVIRGVERNFAELQRMRTITVSYRLRYENVLGKPNYAFDEVHVRNVSQGEMYRTEINATMKSPHGPVGLHRASTWNAKYGMLLLDDESIVITKAVGDYAHYYRYYFDFLCSSIGSARLRGPSRSSIASGGDYWMPDALTRLAGEFRLERDLQTVGDAPCLVLDRPGRDRIWVDPTKDFSIVRRDFFYPGGQPLERTVYRNHKQAGGYWFPMEIVREEFGTPDGPVELVNRVCHRKTIDQVKLSSDQVGDQQFALPIQQGSVVDDEVRGVRYTALSPGGGAALIERAVSGARRLTPASHRFLWLVLGNVLLMALIALAILLGGATNQTSPRGTLLASIANTFSRGSRMQSSISPSVSRRWIIAFAGSSLCLMTVSVLCIRARGRNPPAPPLATTDRAMSLEEKIEYERKVLVRLGVEKSRIRDPKRARELEKSYERTEKSLDSHVRERSALQR